MRFSNAAGAGAVSGPGGRTPSLGTGVPALGAGMALAEPSRAGARAAGGCPPRGTWAVAESAPSTTASKTSMLRRMDGDSQQEEKSVQDRIAVASAGSCRIGRTDPDGVDWTAPRTGGTMRNTSANQGKDLSV